MAKRTTRRLGYGEYASIDPELSQSVLFARRSVLEATRRRLPQFLQELSDGIFPAFCRFLDSTKKLKAFPPSWGTVESFISRTDSEQLDIALRKWARRFNAEEDWVLGDAWLALRAWYLTPNLRESLVLGQNPGHITGLRLQIEQRVSFHGERFQFEWEGWRMQYQTWTNYSEALRMAFDEAAQEYERQCRASASAHGLVSVPRTHSEENFDWFVLYQFGGLSSVEIAKKIADEEHPKSPDPSTILKGVKAAQKLIGWKHLRSEVNPSD
jgi:hypothetical protein